MYHMREIVHKIRKYLKLLKEGKWKDPKHVNYSNDDPISVWNMMMLIELTRHILTKIFQTQRAKQNEDSSERCPRHWYHCKGKLEEQTTNPISEFSISKLYIFAAHDPCQFSS